MVATILIASVAWTAVRTEGITGDHDAQFNGVGPRRSSNNCLNSRAVAPRRSLRLR
jgi:hypothetical protein